MRIVNSNGEVEIQKLPYDTRDMFLARYILSEEKDYLPKHLSVKTIEQGYEVIDIKSYINTHIPTINELKSKSKMTRVLSLFPSINSDEVKLFWLLENPDYKITDKFFSDISLSPTLVMEKAKKLQEDIPRIKERIKIMIKEFDKFTSYLDSTNSDTNVTFSDRKVDGNNTTLKIKFNDEMSLGYIFENISTSKIIPLIRLNIDNKMFYKSNSDFIIPNDWLEETVDENTISCKFLFTKETELIRKNINISNIFSDLVITTKSIVSSVTYSDSFDVVSQDEIDQRIKSFLPPFSKTSSPMTSLNISHAINKAVDILTLADILVMDERFYKRFYISDKSSPALMRKRVNMVYNDPLSSDAKTTFYIGERIKMYNVLQEDTDSILALCLKLFQISEYNKKQIHDIYKKHNVLIKEISLTNVDIKRGIDERRPHIFPKISESGVYWSRRCQINKQPELYETEQEAKQAVERMGRKWDERFYVKFPGDTNDHYICPNDNYPFPGLQKAETQYKFSPCCFQRNQRTRNEKLLRGEDIPKDKETANVILKQNKQLTIGRRGEIGFNIQKLFKTFKINNQFYRYGVVEELQDSCCSILKAVHIALDVEEDLSDTRKRLSEVDDNIINYCKQSFFDMSNQEVRDYIKETEYFDPFTMVELLEEFYNCNIFMFESDSRGMGEIALPRHDIFYSPKERDHSKKLIILNLQQGRDGKYLCELINTTEDIDRERLSRKLFKLYKKIYIK